MKDSSLRMHKYVWGGVVIFSAFCVTFPIAMARVSQSEKFLGQPLKSLTCNGKIPDQQIVTQFSSCVQITSQSKTF